MIRQSIKFIIFLAISGIGWGQGAPVSPSTVRNDSTDPTMGPQYVPGEVNSQATNYLNPYVPGSGGAYPYQLPQYNMYTGPYMNGKNDFFGSDWHNTNVLSASSYFNNGYVDPGGNPIESGPNIFSVTRNLRSLSQAQIGGMYSDQLLNFGGHDTVYRSVLQIGAPVHEGFSEGNEPERFFTSFYNNQPAGCLTLIGQDPVGREQFTMTTQGSCFGFGLDSRGTDRVVFDFTKGQTPTGNITNVSVCSNTNYMCLTADATLTTNLNTLLSTTTGSAPVVGGADEQKYNGACPATVVAPNWGSQTINGSTVAINPYNTNSFGQGGHTTAMCVQLGTVTGTAPTNGEAVMISGADNNWEFTNISSVVTSGGHTYLVLPLNFPHVPGDLITWGAGVGWGLSTPGATVPAGTLNSITTRQYGDLNPMYPVVSWNPSTSTVMVYVNTAAMNAELKLNIYPQNTAPTPLVITPTVIGGVVTALTNSVGSQYSVGGGTGVINVLPPPLYTFTGTGSCTTNPTFHWVHVSISNTNWGWNAVLDTGGSGCPSNFGISIQNTFSNQITLYPITRSYRLVDPSNGSWTDGYYLTQVIPQLSRWANGDYIEQATDTNEYSAFENKQLWASPFTHWSNRTGPQGTVAYGWVTELSGHAPGWAEYDTNTTPSWAYFGDATTNYLPSQTKQYHAQFTPPIWRGLGGQWAGGLDFQVPPSALNGGDIGGGFIIRVGCAVQGQDGLDNQPPCKRSGGRIFQDYWLLKSNGLANFVGINVSDARDAIGVQGNLSATGQISAAGQVHGTDFVPSTGSICHGNGTGCPTIPGIFAQISFPPQTLPSRAGLYVGAPPVVGGNPSATATTLQIPVACTLAEATYYVSVTGTLGSSENVTLNLYNYSQGHLMSTVSLPFNTASQSGTFPITGPNLGIKANDRIQLNIGTPSWATQPTNVSAAVTLQCGTF